MAVRNENYIATEQEASKYDVDDLLQFSYGHIDVTDEDDQPQYVHITPEAPFKLVNRDGDTHYCYDLPHQFREQNWYSPTNPTKEDLIEEFIGNKWRFEGTNNNPKY